MIRLVSVSLLVASSILAADPVQAVREVSIGWTEAVVKQDKAALERLLADDLTYSHASGTTTQTKAEYIAAVTTGPPRYESFTYADVRITVYGKAAVLTGFCDVKMAGSDSFRVRTQHVYVENDGRWQFAAHLSTRVGQSGQRKK